MDFNKEFFLKYLKDNRENVDLNSTYILYKNFLALNEMLENKDLNNLTELSNSDIKKINKYENMVYCINGKKLSEEEKIKIEMKRIKQKLISKNGEYYDDYLELEQLCLLNLSKEENQLYIKKKISIMQSQLGLKITFFYAAYLAFVESYRNLCIKNKGMSLGR